MEKTTIQVDSSILERLKALKQFKRQSYSDLLNNIIDNIEEETLSDEEMEEIKIALDNVKKGKVYPIEEVAKELGVTLK
ncbi:MAG: hypothetical protein WDZ69_00520 [Candidatus Pacearchaeota archaeon]